MLLADLAKGFCGLRQVRGLTPTRWSLLSTAEQRHRADAAATTSRMLSIPTAGTVPPRAAFGGWLLIVAAAIAGGWWCWASWMVPPPLPVPASRSGATPPAGAGGAAARPPLSAPAPAAANNPNAPIVVTLSFTAECWVGGVDGERPSASYACRWSCHRGPRLDRAHPATPGGAGRVTDGRCASARVPAGVRAGIDRASGCPAGCAVRRHQSLSHRLVRPPRHPGLSGTIGTTARRALPAAAVTRDLVPLRQLATPTTESCVGVASLKGSHQCWCLSCAGRREVSTLVRLQQPRPRYHRTLSARDVAAYFAPRTSLGPPAGVLLLRQASSGARAAGGAGGHPSDRYSRLAPRVSRHLRRAGAQRGSAGSSSAIGGVEHEVQSPARRARPRRG